MKLEEWCNNKKDCTGNCYYCVELASTCVNLEEHNIEQAIIDIVGETSHFAMKNEWEESGLDG